MQHEDSVVGLARPAHRLKHRRLDWLGDGQAFALFNDTLNGNCKLAQAVGFDGQNGLTLVEVQGPLKLAQHLGPTPPEQSIAEALVDGGPAD
jgi:hypothetical protein